MANLSMVGVLVGAVFGLHFKVLILFPVIGFAGALVAAASISNGNDVWQVVFAIAVAATSIQLGYLGGTVVRLTFDAVSAKLTATTRNARLLGTRWAK